MRKILFYLFILKKLCLLLIYPAFERKEKIFFKIRKNIENFLIFQPSRLRARRIQRSLLKNIIPQRFVNDENIKLYAWFMKPRGDNPLILHLHGQAESILSHQDIANFCLQNGFGLFMLSYRGHYKSGGMASEQGVYNDAKAAIKQLKKLGIEQDKIILWGHSLGTVIATETALHNNVSGLILQCPIKEIKSAAIDVYKFYCKRLRLKHLGAFAETHINKMDFIQKMDCMSKIKDVRCPILIVHPKTDRVASFQNSIDLAQQNKNAQLYISETGNHWNSDWCVEKVFEFVNDLLVVNQI